MTITMTECQVEFCRAAQAIPADGAGWGAYMRAQRSVARRLAKMFGIPIRGLLPAIRAIDLSKVEVVSRKAAADRTADERRHAGLPAPDKSGLLTLDARHYVDRHTRALVAAGVDFSRHVVRTKTVYR